jgi:hypothetical protein
MALNFTARADGQTIDGRRRSGPGEDFWQYRAYSFGDSAQSIDWRKSARSDRVLVRENEWAASAHRVAVGEPEPGHAVSLSSRRTPRSATVRSFWRSPCRSSPPRRANAWGPPAALIAPGHTACDAQPHGPVVFASHKADGGAPRAAAEDPRCRGIPRPCSSAISLNRSIRSPAASPPLASNDVAGHVVQVLDPAEETLPYQGRTEFLEIRRRSRRLMAGRAETLRERYQARLKEQRDGLRDLARRLGWSFTVHSTGRPPSRCCWRSMACSSSGVASPARGELSLDAGSGNAHLCNAAGAWGAGAAAGDLVAAAVHAAAPPGGAVSTVSSPARSRVARRAARSHPLVAGSLRLALITLVILAVARPLLVHDESSGLTGERLLIVVDDGWAAARQWPERERMLGQFIDAAERSSAPVALAVTAPPPQPPTFQFRPAGEITRKSRRHRAKGPGNRPAGPARTVRWPSSTTSAAAGGVARRRTRFGRRDSLRRGSAGLPAAEPASRSSRPPAADLGLALSPPSLAGRRTSTSSSGVPRRRPPTPRWCASWPATADRSASAK